MTEINQTYILIDKPYVAAGMRGRAIPQGRDISNSQTTAEQTAAIIQREVVHYLQLALAAAQIPGVTPASGSVYAQAAPSAAANATAVRSELFTELSCIDVAVSSRLATAGYTAPDNASVAEIKAKTDNLLVQAQGISTSGSAGPTAGEISEAVRAMLLANPAVIADPVWNKELP